MDIWESIKSKFNHNDNSLLIKDTMTIKKIDVDGKKYKMPEPLILSVDINEGQLLRSMIKFLAEHYLEVEEPIEE